MKVLFINDSTSNPNWGDRAAAIAMKRMIADVGDEIIATVTEDELGAENVLSVPSVAPREDRSTRIHRALKLLVPPVVPKLRRRMLEWRGGGETKTHFVPGSWSEFDSSLRAVTENRNDFVPLFNAIDHADIAIIHGDGAMTGNGLIPRTMLFLAYLIKRYRGIPVTMVNHTVDLDQANLREIARHVYPLFDDVVFRDVISEESTREFCKGRVGADSAFLFEPVKRAQWEPVAGRPTYFDVWPDTAAFDVAKPYLCIGGSSIYHYNRQYDAASAFAGLIGRIQAAYRGQIVLTASDVRDQDLFRPLARRFGLPLLALTTPVQQAVDVVGNADAYIGGRWHPSIFALRGGAPVIPLSSYTFKMKALAEMAGLSATGFDALLLDRESDGIAAVLTTYLEDGSGLRDRLKAWAAAQSERVWENVAYLARR